MWGRRSDGGMRTTRTPTFWSAPVGMNSTERPGCWGPSSSGNALVSRLRKPAAFIIGANSAATSRPSTLRVATPTMTRPPSAFAMPQMALAIRFRSSFDSVSDVGSATCLNSRCSDSSRASVMSSVRAVMPVLRSPSKRSVIYPSGSASNPVYLSRRGGLLERRPNTFNPAIEDRRDELAFAGINPDRLLLGAAFIAAPKRVDPPPIAGLKSLVLHRQTLPPPPYSPMPSSARRVARACSIAYSRIPMS